MRTVLRFLTSSLSHVLVAIVCLSTLPALAQTPTVPRDVQAVTIIQNAVSYLANNNYPQSELAYANGNAISDSTVQGSCSFQPTGSASPTASTVMWMTEGNQYRYDTTLSGQTFSIRSGNGNPVVMSSSATQSISPYTAFVSLPYHMPQQVLASDLANPKASIMYHGTAAFPQGTVYVVEVVQLVAGGPMTISKQLWYFLETTYQPIAIDYRAPGESAANVYMPIRVSYTAYTDHSIGNQHAPLTPTLLSYSNDMGATTCSLTSAVMNTSPAVSSFNAPGGN